MSLSFRNRKLVVAISGLFLRQSAWGVPLDAADIDTRHPMLEPTYPGRIITREEIRDCSGEYLIREDITSRLARLRFSFDADPFLLAGWLSLAQSLATAPSGTPASEVQTFAVTAGTAGFVTCSFPHEGITDTVDIPFDATEAEIKTALERLSNVRAGGIASVTGTFDATGDVVVTFGGRLANANVPLLVFDDTNLTTGSVGVGAETTPGVSRIHDIYRTTQGQNALTSIIVGFEDDTTPPDRYKNVVVNEITVTGQLRGKVTIEVEVFASLDLDPIVPYTMPECVNIEPVYTRDCRLNVDGEWVVSDLREFTYTYRNNIFTGDDSFPYDDIDVSRLEHGDRESRIDFTIYGSKEDDESGLYYKSFNELIKPVLLYVGPPANRVVIDMPRVQLQLADDPIGFAGEASRSTLSIGGPTRYESGVAGVPDRAFYYGPETETFLTPGA